MRPTRAFLAATCLAAGLSSSLLQAQSLFALPANTNWRAELREQAAGVAERQQRTAVQAGKLGCRDFCSALEVMFRQLRTVTEQQFPGSRAERWQLVVTQRAGEEAWALPDGHVFISEEFIRSLDLQRDELAFALAHEIAHFALTHEADTVDIVRRLTPMGLSSSVADVYTALDVDLGLLLRLSPMLEDMELEADQVGLMLAALAGFDPDRAIGLLQKLAGQGERRAVVATHPALARRLAAAQAGLPVARRLWAAAQLQATNRADEH